MIDASFPPDLAQFVQQELASGKYKSEQELVHAAIRAMRDQEINLQRFRAGLQKRLDEIDRGEVIELLGDDALRDFFTGIETEVNAELAVREKHGE
jgi:putative addiction module CopG family antidote